MEKPKLFGTNGIRGNEKKLFTDEFCFGIGVSFGRFLLGKNKKGVLAVGVDPRESSERIKSSFLQGFSSTTSWKLLDEGIIPTPCLNYFVKEEKLAGGVMITGSHIREDLNGIKFFIDEEEITKVNEKEIEKIYYQARVKQKFHRSGLNIKKDDKAKRIYSSMLLGLAQPPYPSWKIVVDAGNGTQSLLIPEALVKLGVEIFKINCNPQKKLVVRDMEVSGVFQDLTKIVRQKKANLGIALDADGDRVVFFDENGKFIPGEYSCSLIARETPGDTIVTPINTSSVVENLGKKVIRTKVGVLYVVKAMKENGAKYGFEANGGGISAEIFYGRDGGSTLIKMLNFLKRRKKTIGELVEELPQYYLARGKVDCPRELNDLILKKAKEKHNEKKIEDLDGLKIHIDKNSWILFRPSGNAPEFRVWTEALTQKRAQALYEEGMNLVKNIIKREKNETR